MNVVVVNDFAHVNGGAGQVALASALGLAERGHKVFMLGAVAPIDHSLVHPNLSVICTGQHEILKDPSRLRAVVQGVWNAQAARAMHDLLDGLDRHDTVVHVHGWTKALSSSVIRAAVARRYAVVTTLHDYFSACPNGGFFNYQEQRLCKLKPLGAACLTTNCDARSYGQKLWRVGRQVVQKNIGMLPGGVRHFISVSDFSVDILRPYLPRDAQIHPLANPILADRGEPVPVRSNTNFVYVGRLAPEKGAALLAWAAQVLGVPAVFVGDGEERLRIIDACPQAVVTGWQSASGVRQALRQARALVLPSLWYETQGLVVKEAAALGIPAIVPDTCAAREAVVDGETGLWFKGGDVQDLQRQMRRLHEDADMAQAMGRAAYERYWAEPSTLEDHLSRLEELYRKVLGPTDRSST